MPNITENTFLNMCGKIDRFNIINECANGNKRPKETIKLDPNIYNKGKKHFPGGDIPHKIWTLDPGTKKEMHKQYMKFYEEISIKDFGDYVRELVEQGILIKKS